MDDTGGNSTDERRSKAVELLQQFGLNEYEAKTYVTLVRLEDGTAKDVSSRSDVPRTRVYDAVEALHTKGLVDVQHSTPKLFRPVSWQIVIRQFRQEYENGIDELETILRNLEPISSETDEQVGVYTVVGTETVEERVVGFIEEADSEIVFMCVEELLTEQLLDALADREQAGVDIVLGGVSEEAAKRLQERLPDAKLLETLWTWEEISAGRILLVDRHTTLASVFTEHPHEETAIWGTGEQNNLVVVLKAMFTCRLDDTD